MTCTYMNVIQEPADEDPHLKLAQNQIQAMLKEVTLDTKEALAQPNEATQRHARMQANAYVTNTR